MTAMIMAVLPHKDGAPNPNRHIHAGRAREWAMIMGVAYLGCDDSHDLASFGGRRRACTQPAAAVPAVGAAGSAATRRGLSAAGRPLGGAGGRGTVGAQALSRVRAPPRLALRPS
jgi:hypothetical protein